MPQKVAVLGLDCAEPSLVFDQFKPRLPVLASLADSRLVLRDGRPVDDGSRIPDPASRLEPAR